MSVDQGECNCGPDPVCIDESSSSTEGVDEDLLKLLEEKNKLVDIHLYGHIILFYKIRFGPLNLTDGFKFKILCCGKIFFKDIKDIKPVLSVSVSVYLCVCRLLETDKRALTRIKSGNDMTEGMERRNSVDQKSSDQKSSDQKSSDQKSSDQKSSDQKSIVSADRKSVGSITENMEGSPDSPSLNRKGSPDSPSLSRKATDEEMWYVCSKALCIYFFYLAALQ